MNQEENGGRCFNLKKVYLKGILNIFPHDKWEDAWPIHPPYYSSPFVDPAPTPCHYPALLRGG